MTLTCEKCGRKHPLTEEEVISFHPRFFCLSCGTTIPFNVPAEKLAELRRSNDPDRRLTDSGKG
jgi:Fe2+ or Zn2+ uptake regulation protein